MVAEVLLLFTGLIFLYDRISFVIFLKTEMRCATVAYSFIRSTANWLIKWYFIPVLPALLLIIVMLTHLGHNLTGTETEIATLSLLLITIIYGPILNLLILLAESFVLLRGLPNGFIFLFLDFLIVCLPCGLLFFTVLGYDLRMHFLYSLLPVIVLSLCLKFYFSLANFKLF